jgi:hypothetical protein
VWETPPRSSAYCSLLTHHRLKQLPPTVLLRLNHPPAQPWLVHLPDRPPNQHQGQLTQQVYRLQPPNKQPQPNKKVMRHTPGNGRMRTWQLEQSYPVSSANLNE